MYIYIYIYIYDCPFQFRSDNRANDRMGPLIARWLRAIFKLSDETVSQIRRTSPANARHMSYFSPAVLERWYAPDCPARWEYSISIQIGVDTVIDVDVDLGIDI